LLASAHGNLDPGPGLGRGRLIRATGERVELSFNETAEAPAKVVVGASTLQ
jgi:hypothetical protein